MAPPRVAPPRALAILALAVAYYATARLGLLLASQPGNVSALWPPSGVALAAMLVWGRGVWPGVLLGSFLANLGTLPSTGLLPLVGTLGIAVGSTLEIAVAARLVERCAGGLSAAAHPTRVVRFAASAGLAATIAATFGLVSTALTGAIPPDGSLRFFLTWWAGDTVGMLVIAPLVLRDEAPDRPARPWEWAAVLLTTLLVGQLVFGRPFPFPEGTSLPVAFLILPPALWAGLRLGARAVAVQALLAHIAISWGSWSGRGPMVVLEQAWALVVSDLLLVTCALAGLLLAASRAQSARHLRGVQDAHRLLESKVAARTRSLAEANDSLMVEMDARARLAARLVESRKQEAIGRLAGGVAHDFNNLLTVIIGEADLLARRPPLQPASVESARIILAAGGRAADLTQQLLLVARGRDPSSTHAIDVASALVEARLLLLPILPATIQLDIHPPGVPCSARIDATHLGQVLLNLAINARDAMPHGGRLHLAADLRPLDTAAAQALALTAGTWVAITVTDTGVGIASEALPKIFEPFYTTKRQGRGTGLGLPTAVGVVSQAGGALRVESTVGVGTAFTIWLPATTNAAAAAPAATTPRQSGTILVVDDEPQIREIVKDVLEQEGYRVFVAADGADGLAIARENGDIFDLVLSDVVMPRMGGPEMVRTLRREREVRVLFMSGCHAADPDVGREPLLPKPFVADRLVAAVREVLGASASKSSADANKPVTA